ncbi:MAG TPA: deoxyribose-phosphate aldolase [Planctomycetota bacterium]|nr:deoxyribose-phosphate aldolase [Planctomycetota bacterium]
MSSSAPDGASRAAPHPPRLPAEIAAYLDHTLLKPDAAERDVDALCAEAAEHRFAAVCVNPVWASRCVRALEGTGVAACVVVGFPLGASRPESKAFEARRATDDGAREIDMVLAIGALKSGRLDDVRADVRAVVEAAGTALVKVILETCLLDDAEKRVACRLAVEAGAAFVKTSTGFAKGGATVADVALLRAAVGPKIGVKASGGIRDRATFDAMVEAGATRVGASASLRILRGD